MADYMVINVLSSVCQKPKNALLNLARAKTPSGSSQLPNWLLRIDKVAVA